jgi:uncharacterized DUF497 family protein
VSVRDPLGSCVGFDWDEANTLKNWQKHAVTPEEAEEVFFHEPLLFQEDQRHSAKEKRYQVLGETSVGRRLLVVFAVRKKLIRVISTRDMTQRESEAYDRYEKENT